MKNESSDNGHGSRYCSFCQIKFGLAEASTTKGGKEYHLHCQKKLQEKGNVETHPEAQPELQVVPLEDLFYEKLQLQLDFENGVERSVIQKSVH